MILKNIKIHNFRNLKNINLDFCSKFNVFFGNNGQGKTSIIEAIYLLANMKSFRSGKNSDLITFGKNEALINSDIDFFKCHKNYKIIIKSDGKSFFINNKRPDYLNDYLGSLKAVVFNPEDVNIINGYPQHRRALLDRAIFLSEPDYINKILYFNKCLKQRNHVLKNNTKNIIAFTDIFLKSSFEIYKNRIHFIKKLNPIFKNVYENISKNSESPEILYKNNDLTTLFEKLKNDLDKNNDKEREFGQTLYGPHRDDPLFLLNNVPIKKYGSQGQQKTFILAFKAAQILELKKSVGISPVLLLDDMTSELDQSRQSFFYDFLLNQDGQVFLTSTDKKIFYKNKLLCNFYEVKNGEII
ncbi:MAG: DNA replication and repair protein RecF [Desulfuromonadales bacterium]|nr:DNA replication and repair protein RecF [Desulfuromonadales bacterium]